MATTFIIATIGDTKDNAYFEVAKKQLEQRLAKSGKYAVEFVDITGKNEEEIYDEGSFHGAMYFTNIHDSDNVETFKTLLNSQLDINDFNLFALSHEPVTEAQQVEETERLQSYVKGEFPDAEIHVSPANVRTAQDMRAVTESMISLSMVPYFKFVGPIEKQTEQKVKTLLDIVKDSLEFKHDYTAGHVYRVSKFAKALAIQMGCTEKEVQDIVISSALHDIGKLLTPDEILASSSALNRNERKQMDYHSLGGAQLLEALAAHDSELAKILNPEVMKGIKYHHKDWDGRHDKSTDEIDPINHERIGKYATIIAAADCLDAMISQRAYNNPKHILDTFRDFWDHAGTQFEPEVAKASVLMLGKEIAQLGYDPVKMFSEVSKVPWKAKIDTELQQFFQEHSNEIEVNKNPEPDAYGSLGFRLNKEGYFEFEEENSPKLDPSIRYESEVDFLVHHTDKIGALSNVDISLISKEEIKKAAELQAKMKFHDQDKDGREAMERAFSREIEHDIPNEVYEFSQEDNEINTTSYEASTKLTREGLINEKHQKEAGIENATNSFVTVPDSDKIGDR